VDRKSTFILALTYLIVILTLGLLFFVKRDLLFFVPEANVFGQVPVGVPWFGALGAVLISLTGVFEHEHDWDASYWPWHVARPLVGVAVGVISVLILQAGVLAVGATPTNTTVPKNLLYYLVAFLVGYREETFRELIKRLVDIILAPGNGKSGAPTIQAVNPASAPHGTATQVTITGSGFASTQSVKFGASAGQFTINGDGKLTVTTPVVAAGGAVVITVTTKGGSASTDFTFN
jgi:IPT/TIG domain